MKFNYELIAEFLGTPIKPTKEKSSYKVLGYCANCNHDIIEGDHMDCCGNLELVEKEDK